MSSPHPEHKEERKCCKNCTTLIYRGESVRTDGCISFSCPCHSDQDDRSPQKKLLDANMNQIAENARLASYPIVQVQDTKEAWYITEFREKFPVRIYGVAGEPKTEFTTTENIPTEIEALLHKVALRAKEEGIEETAEKIEKWLFENGITDKKSFVSLKNFLHQLTLKNHE